MCLQGVIAASVEALLPSLCIHCGEPLGGREACLCGECWTSLIPLTGSLCSRCSGPTDDVEQACLECVGTPPPQLATVVWGGYEGVLRTAVLALKHRGRDELAEPLGRRLAGRISEQPWTSTIDWITAVPSHRLRQLRRGPTAATSLARVVAAELGRPLADTLRRRGFGRQAGRTRAQRLMLGPNSFRCRTDIEGRRVLLVDDVTTTGATLRRATEVLAGGGATAVYCAALAQTPDARRLT